MRDRPITDPFRAAIARATIENAAGHAAELETRDRLSRAAVELEARFGLDLRDGPGHLRAELSP